MFEKIRKMKNQKGFTLVELIVVLVILAILAAMLVPALTGYIDKATEQKMKAVTRQVVMAAQTELSETYSKTTLTTGKITIENTKEAPSSDGIADFGGKVVELAEVGKYEAASAGAAKKYTLNNGIGSIVIEYNKEGHVTKVVLTQGSKTCTYEKDKEETYTVTP